MKKLLLILMIGIFLVSLVPVLSATQVSLGVFKQGECIGLIQTCANCTYNNISRVFHPDATKSLDNNLMTKDDTYYNYSFCNTSQLGTYIVNGFGDIDGIKTSWSYDLDVTPSGDENVLGLFIIVIFIAYAIGFIGFFGKHEWVSVMGGFAMMLLGVYILINGIDVYRNFMTIALSSITAGLGAIFALVPLLELLRDN